MIRLNCRRSIKPASWVAVGVLASGTASAHSALGASRWWDGSLHVLLSPLSLAALVAMAAALSQTRRETAIGLAFAAGLCGFLAASMLPLASAMAIAPLGAIAAGLVAAMALSPPNAIGLLLAVMVGVSAGLAASPDERLALDMAAGAGFAIVAVSGHAFFLSSWLAKRQPLVPRVAGAWCGAIGLMMGALAFVR